MPIINVYNNLKFLFLYFCKLCYNDATGHWRWDGIRIIIDPPWFFLLMDAAVHKIPTEKMIVMLESIGISSFFFAIY